MYPLMKPALEELASQIYEKQSLEDITYEDDNKYTSMLLLEAIKSALAKASVRFPVCLPAADSLQLLSAARSSGAILPVSSSILHQILSSHPGKSHHFFLCQSNENAWHTLSYSLPEESVPDPDRSARIPHQTPCSLSESIL